MAMQEDTRRTGDEATQSHEPERSPGEGPLGVRLDADAMRGGGTQPEDDAAIREQALGSDDPDAGREPEQENQQRWLQNQSQTGERRAEPAGE
jgi:hypothetical protein